MASKKTYSRYFIILQEDEKGNAISSDKQPSGYTKIETKNDKCKVSFYVQNVKKDNSQCYMVIVCNKKDTKKLINLGPLNIDENGRADVSYECHIDNIGGTSMGVDKVGGATIMKIVGGKYVHVLSGFSSTEIPENWKEYSLVEGKKLDEVKITEKKDEKKEEKQDKKEDHHGHKDDYEKEKVKEKNKEDGKCEVKVEAENKNEKESNFDQYEKEIETNKDRDTNNEDTFPKGSVGEFFQVVLDGLEEVKDVTPELNMCKWYKVPVKDLDVMCNMSNYNKYTIVYYPMINYYPYIKKYGHFMIGLKCDSQGELKYLVYAIPGTKDKADQPYGGKSGFVTWMPEKIEDGKESEMGHWMMFYDFRNSIIVVPMK